nr:elicitin-like protein [Pythium porphyrae]
MMKFAVLAALAISTVAAADVQCQLAVLAPLLQDADLTACAAASGLQFPPTAAPTEEVVTKVCATPACQSILAKVEATGLGDCVLGAIKLESQLINPIKEACGWSDAAAPVDGASSAMSMEGSSAMSMEASAGSDMMTAEPVMEEPMMDDSASGSMSAEMEPEMSDTPAPTADSSAATVTVAAGAAVAAVAASMW